MKKLIKLIILIVFASLFFGAITRFVLAADGTSSCPSKAEYKLDVPLPFIPNPVCGPASYLSGLYKLAVGVAVLLAAIMIIYGGVLHTISGDNASKQKEARGYIFNSILGLVLLLASYLILNTINPDLVNLGQLQSRIQGKAEINVAAPLPVEQWPEACQKCLEDRSSCKKGINNKYKEGWFSAKRYDYYWQKCSEGYDKCVKDAGCFTGGEKK